MTAVVRRTEGADLAACEAGLREALPRVTVVTVERERWDGTTLDGLVAPTDADVVLVLDADQQVRPEALVQAVALAAEAGVDAVVGPDLATPETRLLHPDRRAVLVPHSRSQGTWSPTAVARLLTSGAVRTAAEPWLEPAVGDRSLPLHLQRRFRSDLARERSTALVEVRAAAAATEQTTGQATDLAVGLARDLLPQEAAHAVGGGEPFREAWQPLAREVVEGLTGDEPWWTDRVPAGGRLLTWALAHGTWPDVARLARHGAEHRHGFPVDDDLVELPAGLDLELPAHVRRLGAADRLPHVELAGAWQEGGSLVVRGVAFREHVPGGDLPLVEVRVAGATHPATVTRWTSPEAEELAARPHEDRAGCGFEAVAEVAARTDEVEVVVALDPADASGSVARRVRVTPSDGAALLGAEVDGDGLRLVLGSGAGPREAPRLRGPRGVGLPGSVVPGTDRTEVVVPLRSRQHGEEAWLPAGRYELDPDPGPVVLPRDTPEPVGERLRVTFARSPKGRLQVVVGAPLDAWQRSERGQEVSRRRAGSAPSRPGTVVLETFRGRSSGDNPGPIAVELARRDLGLDLAVVVDDPAVRVPPGTRPLVRRSAEWFELMAGAGAYVANAAAPSWFVKREGQVHLQTWHGTPLKRIGEDRGRGDLEVWSHRRDVESQAARWDGLVSQNPLSSSAFRTAFLHDGPLLETGYPRNDLLLDPVRSAAARESVRTSLGIRPDQQVVLYAPTWREYAGRRDAKPLFLDAEAVTRARPDAVVLVRGHYNATGGREVFADHPRIHDVTRHPDIAPLYCAADVLVTDYSSVMFDFVLTDRQVVLLVPDLEQYRDVERGFYFDIETHSPGPLLRTTEEVLEVLGGPDTGESLRQAFRSEFCPWDDGRAAARVADWLLERMG